MLLYKCLIDESFSLQEFDLLPGDYNELDPDAFEEFVFDDDGGNGIFIDYDKKIYDSVGKWF